MQKKYKIIDSVILACIIILVLSLTIYSYILVNNAINDLKLKFTNKISKILNRKISIGTISPLFFNGIKIKDFFIYEDVLNKKIAYINTIKIRIKLKDILTKKISLDRSISSIILQDFKFNLEKRHFDQIKSMDFNNGRTNENGASESNMEFDLIFKEGIINIALNNKDEIQLNNNYSIIDLQDNEFDTDLNIKFKKLYGMNLKDYHLSLQIEGGFSKEVITAQGKISDITLNDFFYDNLFQFNVIIAENFEKINLELTDNKNSLKMNLKKEFSSVILKAIFKRFPISNYTLNGYADLNKSSNKLDYKISLNSNPKDKLFINIKGNDKKLTVKDFKIYFKKKDFLYINGFYNISKNYFFKVWLNNYKYNNFKFLGKAMFFSDKDNNHKIKLANFKINDFTIRNYVGVHQYFNNSIKLQTLASSENFTLSINNNMEKKLFDLKLNLKDFRSEKFYKLFKINYKENARINGDINLKLYDDYITVINKLQINFLENQAVKKIYLKSSYKKKLLDINYKVILKNNKIVLIKAKSKNVHTLKGTVNYDNINKDFILSIKGKRKHYLLSLLYDKMNLKIKYFNNNSFTAILNINKQINDYLKTRLILNASASGNAKNFEKINFKGDLKLINILKDGKITLAFKKLKNKIKFKDINIKLDKNLIHGKGEFNLRNRKINITLDKMKIKGKIDDNQLNVYLFFNKFKNFYYKNSLFNLNGFLNVKYSFDFFRIYGDMNIYNFKYKNMKIPEIYTVFIYHNNNIIFKKLNFDYLEGKVICDVKSFYRKNEQYYGETVINFKKIMYNNNKINAKIYTKFNLNEKILFKIKIIKFLFNDLKLEDIDEEIQLHNNKLTFIKLNKNGFKGYIDFLKHGMNMDLTFNIGNNEFKFYGKKNYNILDYNIFLNNINMKNFYRAVPFIKKADGRINSKISITGNVNNPKINGFLEGNELYFKLSEIAKRIDDLNLKLIIKDNSVKIKQCRGTIGKGDFSFIGNVLLKNYKIDNYDFIFKTLGKKGIYIEKSKDDFSGNAVISLQIKGGPKELGIGGKIILNNMDFTWPFAESDSEGESLLDDTKMDLNVDIIAGKNVNFFQNVNNIDVLVKEGGKFNIKGDIRGKHKVIGKMEAEKGSLDYFGTHFEIIYANIAFSSHYHENVPWISAKAEAETRGIEEENVFITMIVEGRAYNNLAPQLTSIPSLTQREIFLLLNDSTFYVSDSVKSEKEEQEEINNLIKIGFIQIFDSTYQSKLITPIGRKAKRFLGLDLLKIRTSIVKNLLEPKLYKLDEHGEKSVNPFADTRLSVGKYVADNLLLKYSIILKENSYLANLYYEQKLGFEWKILRSLNFEYLYYPLFYNEYSQPYSEQKYKLEWKQKISF